ncbi:hypothetical protein LRP88_10633 [Fusarium phalaenopsidis]
MTEPMELMDDTMGDVMDVDLDLRDKIFDAMQENNEGKEFIPADVIACLASRDAVEAELMGKARHGRLARLIDYIFNKPAIKVFLILVSCDNVGAMDEISASGFGDKHLPLDEQVTTNGGKRQSQLQSLSQNCDAGSVLDPLLSWRLAQRRVFLEKQWVFMAPVFTREKFAYKLHNRCPLPFIPFNEKDHAQNGTHGGLSGSVQEIKVHEAHQKVLPQMVSNSTQTHEVIVADRRSGCFEFGGLVGDIRARSKGCDLCLLFSQAASKLKWEDSVRLLSRRVDSVIRIMPDGPTILSLYSDPEHAPASPDAQTGYPLLPKPGSPSQFAFIREWLRVCRETHRHEHLRDASLDPTELPTRVIDLGFLDKPKIQLVPGEAMESHEYFALSHCWGKGMMFRAMKENIKTLAEAIDFRRLPRTFQEAIKTTRRLNVRYLWIDSLCIIQDDQEDWEREAARMQQVFSNATCVIAASSAGSSAEGFLETRRDERPFVTLHSPSGSISYVCKFIDNFAQDMEEAPLNKRGWVLQERALARRSVHFTSTQVYLECGEGVHCESLMNDKAAFLGDSDFPNSVLEYYKGGRIVLSQNLFKMYSSLKFTNSSDRPIAISGLEKRLMSAFKTRGGYGVFQAFFERSLLWQRPESGPLARIAYPADRSVPSWSWMFYSGGITYVDAPFEEVDWTKDYESPFESRAGRQYWGTNENNPSPVIKSKSAKRFSPSADPKKVLERIRFDLDTYAHLQLGALRCIVIGKAKSSGPEDAALHYVLVITGSSSDKAGVYVRVGVGILLKSLISWGSEEYVEVH